MKMISIPFTEAKVNLSKYGKLAEKGVATTVLKHRRPAFQIAPLNEMDRPRPKHPGLACGQIRKSPDFDIMPDDVLADFEGES
ncbi:MAG TPA: type II toxin-antitoxin system prevent-host-death family antitoxin [Kiritimatiellia bacterium]|nr:type II toxin-antitoxin system prevent-host-death family antitoxin [Kiritimatiellia bacterium]